MSWEKIEPPKKALKAHHDVRVSYKSRGKAGPLLRTSLTEKIIGQLGWTSEQKLDALFGVDDQAGLVRLQPNDEDGRHTLSSRKAARSNYSFFILNCGHIPALGMISHDMEDVEFEADRGCLNITLPVWGGGHRHRRN